MSEFKIGQRVRVTGKGATPIHGLYIGEVGVVIGHGTTEGKSYDVRVERPGGDLGQYVHPSELVYAPRAGDRVQVKEGAQRHNASNGTLIDCEYAGQDAVVWDDELDGDGDVVLTGISGLGWVRPEDVIYLGSEDGDEDEDEDESLVGRAKRAQEADPLRVGDRVRIIDAQHPMFGQEGFVTGIQKWGIISLSVDSLEIGLFRSRLEKIEEEQEDVSSISARATTTLPASAARGGEEQGIRPSYYGGTDNPYEAIKVIEAWGLNFSLGSVVKYVARTGKKDPAAAVEDLQKAATYLQLEINRLNNERGE